jgi:hypothetical protein
MKNTRIIAAICGGVTFGICLVISLISAFDVIPISNEMSITYGVGSLISLFMCCWGLDETEDA